MSVPPAGLPEAFAERAERLGVPVSVLFQITDRCNYRCAHCYETHGEADELSFDEIDRVLGEIADAGVLFLTVTGGEVFMRRDADAILAAARRRRFAVRLLTTGHFVDDARADRLADLAIQEVHLSLYGPDAESHERVTLLSGSFERTVAAARRLRARGVVVVIKSPVMTVNVRRHQELVALVDQLGCKHTMDPKLTAREDGDRSPLHLRPSTEDLTGFYASYPDASLLARHGAAPRTFDRATANRGSSCSIGRRSCSINPQGLVFGCGALPVAVGDLRRDSFRAIWQGSPKLRELRALSWTDIAVCRDCALRPYCSRCHAMALLEDGNMLGPSKEACRHAVALREALRARGAIPEDAPRDLPVPLRQDAPPVEKRVAEKLAYGYRPATLRIID